MNYKYLIDTFAWVEYFRGTKKGEIVRDCIEKGKVFTPTIVLAELSDLYERKKVSNWERDLGFIISKTTILDLNQELATESGKTKNDIRKKHKTKFGLADAIILATARKMNAKVVTGDKHFEKISEVLFL